MIDDCRNPISMGLFLAELPDMLPGRNNKRLAYSWRLGHPTHQAYQTLAHNIYNYHWQEYIRYKMDNWLCTKTSHGRNSC